MFGFNINGSFLDMPESASISLTINNPIYTGGDPTEITGSYSLPVVIPLTKNNKILLDNPHRIDNHANFIIIKGVILYLEGLPAFKGDLKVFKANDTTARITYIINPFAEIKGKKLAEILTGSYFTPFSWAMKVTAKATTTHPGDYDFVFFPVFNREWKTPEARESGNGEFDYMLHRCQNFYDVDSEKFVTDAKNVGATPFLKYYYAIRTILEASGHALIDEFFDDELKNLCFYNNKSISNQDGTMAPVINYANHCPDIEAAEFIKQFCALFFLGIFANPMDNTILLKPLKDVLAEPEKVDWTAKTKPEIDIVNNESRTPNQYIFATDGADQLSELHTPRDFAIAGEVATDAQVPESTPAFPQYYYCTDQNQVILNLGFLKIYKYFLDQRAARGLDTYEIKLSPLFMTRGQRALSYTYSLYAPEVGIRGRHDFDAGQDDAQAATAGHRIVFFRGYQPTKGGKSFPMASNHNYNYAGAKIGEYSLLLNGPDGILEKWGKEVLVYLANRRTVQRIINLSIKDILNFKPQNKIRIENNNYFVSQMKITITSAGIAPVQCTLETTL